MNYYERHIGDYLKDTAHLSLLEHGIYGRLLDIYYSREAALPGDQIARLVGAKTDDERAALLCVLNEFFVLDGEGAWTQGRCESEIERFKEKQAQAKRAAAASVAARQATAERALNDRSTDAERALNVPSLQSQSPITKKEKTPTVSRGRRCPEGFDPGLLHIAQMRTECPDIDVERETAKFRDWEFKTPRSDWSAAWRTWMRKAQDDLKSRAPPKSFRERDEEAAAARFAAFTGRKVDALDNVIDMEPANARIGNG